MYTDWIGIWLWIKLADKIYIGPSISNQVSN